MLTMSDAPTIDLIQDNQEDISAFPTEETTEETQVETPEETPDEDMSEEGDAAEEAPKEDAQQAPFHEHPRFQKLLEDRRTDRETIDLLKQELEGIKSAPQQESQPAPAVPEWFSNILYGAEKSEIEKEWDVYIKQTDQTKQTWIDQAVSEFERRQSEKISAEQKAQDEANAYVEEQLQTLEGEGLKFDKNKLFDIAIKYNPTNNEGLIDLRKAYDLMTILEQKDDSAQKEARKKIAEQTSPDKSVEDAPRKFKTNSDFRTKF